jgi:HK97 family phage portal protein
MFFNVSAKRRAGTQQPRNNFIFSPAVSGVDVNDESAFKYSAFFACMRIISETIAYLPWRVIVQGTKTTLGTDSKLDDIIYRRPNSEINSFIFKEILLQHLLGWGNAYCEIERSRAGDIVNLWPIDPSLVNADRDSNGRLYYDVMTQNGPNQAMNPKDIFALCGPSRDGIVGYSVIQQAKETISMGLAAEAFGAAFFGNGAIPYTIITNDGGAKLSPEGVKNMLNTFNRKNKGAKNAMKTEYLDAGLKIDTLGIPPQDAQYLESRAFQIKEICRWFRVPPHKLADLERSTHTNIEAQNIEFVTDAVIPWVSRLEKQADYSLVRYPDKFYTKMNVLGLLRGDSKARSEYYHTLANLGVLSIDEIREKEDMDSIGDDGDLRLVPMNMTTPERAKSGDLAPNKQAATNIVKDTAARFVKIELARLEKLSDKRDLQGIANFYVGHARSLVDGFANVASLFCADNSKKDGKLQEFFGRYIEESAASLQKAIESGGVEPLFCSWRARKAENLTRDLIGSLSND